jgi:hypothetical protein
VATSTTSYRTVAAPDRSWVISTSSPPMKVGVPARRQRTAPVRASSAAVWDTGPWPVISTVSPTRNPPSAGRSGPETRQRGLVGGNPYFRSVSPSAR